MTRALLVLAIATGLSGCVAAAAIPLAASGAMLRSDAVSGGTENAPASAAQTVEAAQPTPADQSNTQLVRLDISTLPPPTEADVRAGAERRIEARSFDSFYGYALAQASLDPLDAPMRSALLTNPGSLEPIRQLCGAREPVVLVDLDPRGALFDPASAGKGSAPLGEVLAVLRSRGVAIAWISGLGQDAESAVRARLATERLDPTGADRLLLVDQAKASKQELRIALAGSMCPIAIAGDTREDFDELYAYLKNPEAAYALNEMFGAGWFLTPNPID